jgi:hypothetical protein
MGGYINQRGLEAFPVAKILPHPDTDQLHTFLTSLHHHHAVQQAHSPRHPWCHLRGPDRDHGAGQAVELPRLFTLAEPEDQPRQVEAAQQYALLQQGEKQARPRQAQPEQGHPPGPRPAHDPEAGAARRPGRERAEPRPEQD